MLWKCCTQYISIFGKQICGHGTWKGQFSFQWKAMPKNIQTTPEMKGNAKEYSNYPRNVLITHTRKVMLKILQTKLQQYMNCELPDVQADFRKGRGIRNQMANICWIIKKASSRKIYISALLTMPKTLTVWIAINCRKFWKRWEYQTT